MKKAKKIALSAILSALCVTVLYLGSLIDVLDLSVSLFVSFLILFCVAELGYSSALSAYFATSVLSLILLPNKAPALLFSAIFGYMPITKFFFERHFKRLAWIPKALLFNGTSIAVGLLFWELLGFSTENILGIPAGWMKLLYLFASNIVFFLADLLYTRLVLIYMNKYRTRVSKYLK